MDATTHELLRTSLRAVLSERSDRSLADRLADLGWDEVVADDAPEAWRTLFETKGETLAADDVLGPLMARTAAPTQVPTVASVVLSRSLGADQPPGEVVGADLVVDGAILGLPGPSAPLLVRAADADRSVAVVSGSALDYRPADGTDPDLGLRFASGRLGPAHVEWIGSPEAGANWTAAVALGRWSVAAELVGIGRTVIAGAVAYTTERRQYGRAIGTFQALQHRLAAAHASVVGAAAVGAEAARSGSTWDALVAKALAGHAVEYACTQAQQCYGAIGFTWEHPFHRSLRRVYLLDRLLGGWRELESEIGARLRHRGDVPRIGAL